MMADIGRRRERAALLLAQGQDVRAVAGLLSIGERTLHRWRTDPAFRQQVQSLRSDMMTTATGRLSAGLTAAADKLRSLLDATDDRIALAAAKSLLELTLRLNENVELAQRLDELEQRIELRASA